MPLTQLICSFPQGKVRKDSPTPSETRIDDVVVIYNPWIKSKAEIRTIAPPAIPRDYNYYTPCNTLGIARDMNPGYCTGYESDHIHNKVQQKRERGRRTKKKKKKKKEEA